MHTIPDSHHPTLPPQSPSSHAENGMGFAVWIINFSYLSATLNLRLCAPEHLQMPVMIFSY